MDKDRLIKIGNNKYLDPSDPLFLDKLMKEFPNLKPEVAQQYVDEALKATSKPVSPASGVRQSVVGTQALRKKNKEAYWYEVAKWAMAVSVFVLLLLLFCLFTLKMEEKKKIDEVRYTETSHQVVDSVFGKSDSPVKATRLSNVKSSSSLTRSSALSADDIGDWVFGNIGNPVSREVDPVPAMGMNVDEAALKTALLRTAVESYKAKHGTYPSSVSALIGQVPENWLSVIPSQMTYEVSGGRYKVYPDGFDPNCTCKPSKLELAFFPEVNQLALMQGQTVLSVYPVASAKSGSELPYTESQVTERVVNPNGGNKAYGKRALALTENYAIHGTNDQESIGKRVSHGCIRMKDVDIEELYPYVPLGTPFKVKKGKPEEPMYPKGLPDLGGGVSIPAESRPDVIYTWHS